MPDALPEATLPINLGLGPGPEYTGPEYTGYICQWPFQPSLVKFQN